MREAHDFSRGRSHSFGVFFDFIAADVGASRTDTGLVFSIQLLTLYLSAAVFGNVVDRYSTRPLVLVGTLFLGLGMVGASQAATVIELYLSYGLVAGSGMGVVYVISVTATSRWFQRSRAMATAIATSGVGVATLVAPPVTAHFIGVVGWQTTYLLLTGTLVAALLVVALLFADSPEAFGADASAEFPEGATEAIGAESWREQAAETVAIVRKPAFLLVFFAWVCVTLPVFTLLAYLVTFTTDVGMPRWAGVWAVSLYGGMTIPGRVMSGVVGDRIGRLRYFALLSVIVSVGVMVLPFIRDPIVLLAFAVCYGLLQGGTGALFAPLVADLFGAQRVTTLFGITAPAFGIAGLAGPYFAGLSFEELGGYTPFFTGAGLLSLLGVAALVYAGQRVSGGSLVAGDPEQA